MPITSNVGGVLHELDIVSNNVGGVTHELDVVNSNVGGVLKEIHSGVKSKIRFDPSVWTRSNFSDDTQISYSFNGHRIHLGYTGRFITTKTENSALIRIYILKVNPGDVLSIDFAHDRSDDYPYYVSAEIHQVVNGSVGVLSTYNMGGSSGSRTISVTSQSDNIYIIPQCNYGPAVTWNLYINSISINGIKLF